MQKALVIHNLGSQKQKTFDATSLFTISLKIFALVSSVNSAALQRSDPSPNDECSLSKLIDAIFGTLNDKDRLSI